MSIRNLKDNCEFAQHLTYQAAGTGTLTPTAGIDTAGYEGVAFIIAMGAIAADAVVTAKLQQSSDDGVADGYSDLEGTALVIADGNDSKVVVTDIYRPQKRYVKLIITIQTDTAAVNAVVAVLYDPKVYPVTHDTDLCGTSEFHASPDEGTA